MSEEQTGGSNIDKAIPEVEVEIGGVKHKLEYSLWSFCKLDELTGKNPLVGSSWAETKPKDILALLWAGLLHEPNAMTLEELGKKISVKEINTLAPLIVKAMGQATPAPDEEKKTPSNSNTPS